MRVRIAILVIGLAMGGCAAPLDPLYPEVLVAREAWTKNRPLDYSFVIFSSDGHYSGKVTVVGGKVASPANARTLEDFWQEILFAKSRGTLLESKFTSDGVPISWSIWLDEYGGGGEYREVSRFQRQ